MGSKRILHIMYIYIYVCIYIYICRERDISYDIIQKNRRINDTRNNMVESDTPKGYTFFLWVNHGIHNYNWGQKAQKRSWIFFLPWHRPAPSATRSFCRNYPLMHRIQWSMYQWMNMIWLSLKIGLTNCGHVSDVWDPPVDEHPNLDVEKFWMVPFEYGNQQDSRMIKIENG